MYLYIAIALFVIFLFSGYIRDLRKSLFAKFMAFFIKNRSEKFEAIRRDFFKPLKDVTSFNPDVRKENGLRILEIGVGTGTNFDYYPSGTKLTVIDPNPHFKKYYDENRKKFPNIQSEEIIIAYGEEMDMVESDSVDVVVVTHVMCSVVDTEKFLKQIKRVLAPGGKFFFIEHILEFERKFYIRRFMQQFLTVTGIFPFFFENCHFNRDTASDINDAGFSKVDAKKIHLPVDKFYFYTALLSSHLFGTATK